MEVIQISKEEFIKLTKQVDKEVLDEELPKILKEYIIGLIPEEEPEEDEMEFVNEEIKEKDYIDLNNVLKKYES